MKVFCYFNLHKHCWSIKALEGINKGRVVAHAKRVNISNAVFKVSEAGRQRVIREGRKNVHAGVSGQWDGHCDADPLAYLGEAVAVSYNPYKAPSFICRESGDSIHSCQAAHLGNRSASAYI